MGGRGPGKRLSTAGPVGRKGGVRREASGQASGRRAPPEPGKPSRTWTWGRGLSWYFWVQVLPCPLPAVRCGTRHLGSLSLSAHLSSEIVGLASQRVVRLRPCRGSARRKGPRRRAPRWERFFLAAK
ncbi:hypothetical protein mRhiFer1_010269 [Rhinolophus ferrumequinum]|uniref:Uncharacterized protein n=1 Tax=Rhinolophus ferrumequinum TaxID=59479 RepID=A0A7J7X5S1_RHIFE|nr:hypothetical protein mRhiFer1_010269 [Rhinolophus ferrumequinum]